ncbi:hypothetical protein BGZ65_011567 [Modicella reniformis]|uniref:30S ribosomal protein S15, chloroplastic n=1 Tax=Modicella reniformis TaxID=1440133 RepID=A0A9P6IHZ6_9FUNG|nr:hypothetical protein BGZ65_011567 [Modicella reniformis]
MFSKATSPSSDFSSLLLTLSPSEYIQHHLKNLKIEPIFGTVRQIHLEMRLRITFMSEILQMPIEEQTGELVRRLTALENRNTKQITFKNTWEAKEALQCKKRDKVSPEVQVASMTVKIHNMHKYLKKNKKDKHSYCRSLILIQKRKKILKGLRKIDPERYRVCLDRLGLDLRDIENEIVVI